jgi:hypothetical protein
LRDAYHRHWHRLQLLRRLATVGNPYWFGVESPKRVVLTLTLSAKERGQQSHIANGFRVYSAVQSANSKCQRTRLQNLKSQSPNENRRTPSLICVSAWYSGFEIGENASSLFSMEYVIVANEVSRP